MTVACHSTTRFLPLLLVSLGTVAACSAASPGEATGEASSEVVASAAYAPAPADFDGDGKADMSLRTADGHWVIDRAYNGFNGWDESYSGYAGPNAVPVPADYDGDHKADFAFVSHGTWYIDFQANGFGKWDKKIPDGSGTDWVPVPGDYDGDQTIDRAFREPGGAWHIDFAKGGFGAWDVTYATNVVGATGQIPCPADFDGDGITDICVKDDAGRWHVNISIGGFAGGFDATYVQVDAIKGIPYPADYDGDGHADIAVLAPNGNFLIDYFSSPLGWDVTFDGAGMGAPRTYAPADYDGDGKTDLSLEGTSPRGTVGIWAVERTSVHPGSRSWDVMENVETPAPAGKLCSTLSTSCTLSTYSDPYNYFAKLSAAGPANDFSCGAPGTFHPNDPASPAMVHYTVCTDSAGLRNYLPNANWGQSAGPIDINYAHAYAEDNVCNACLPRATLGHVYVVWDDALGPNMIGPQCNGGCSADPGI